MTRPAQGRPVRADPVKRAFVGTTGEDDRRGDEGLEQGRRHHYRSQARSRMMVHRAVLAIVIGLLATSAAWSVVSDMLAH